MADKQIGELPQASILDDESLLPMEQDGQAQVLSGLMLRRFAEESGKAAVHIYVDAAKESAKSAAESQSKAAASEQAATQSEKNILEAEEKVVANAELAAESQSKAAASEKAAALSEENVLKIEQNVSALAEATANAQSAAKESQEAAALSEEHAANSKESASADAKAAAKSQNAAAESQEAAALSEVNAARSAETAAQYSGNPPKPINGTWWIWNAETGIYEDTGVKSILSIVKSYASVAEMEEDVFNRQEGDLVIIAAEINREENSQLYIHTGLSWEYLSDLSGIQGVGITDIELSDGNHAPGTTDVYTITLTDGRTFSLPVYNGKNGEGTGDMVAAVYDPRGLQQDIFAYVDEQIGDVNSILDSLNGEVI